MATEQLTIRDELRARLNLRPFHPFVVELTDGTRHFIVRVAQMAVGLTTGIIAEPAGDSSRKIKLTDVASVKDP